MPFLVSETDIGQLDTIFRALGSPTEVEWPGLKLLPSYYQFKTYIAQPLELLFTAASQDTLDLLSKLLKYDPLTRITAKQCLEHEYFSALPRPTQAHKLPSHVVPKEGHAKRKTQFDGNEGK